MLLKFLELQGFKTFPEKTVLSFKEGLTTVVGPNGSGKSNISDAIRWVLGEQSAKALRCSKMEDIIFNGTTTQKPKGFAQVTLTIDNKEKQLPLDGDEVSITRRYYRSGESEYLINQKEVRMKDVHELFMDTGLGKDGYSIISQGKIDDIVASKSEDRREIFEEAAGISKYRYRKSEAERKLEKANENLVRITDILGELEKQVGPLFEQSEKAKKYLTLSEEFKKLQIGLWLYELEKSNDLIQKEEAKLKIVQNQYDEVDAYISRIISETENTSKKIIECTSKLDGLRREISANDNLSTKERGEISVLNNDILHNSDRIVRIKAEIENARNFFKNIDDYLEKSMAKKEKLQVDIAEKESELNTAAEKQTNTSDKETKLKNELSAIGVKERSLMERLNQLKVEKIYAKNSFLEQKEKKENRAKNEEDYKIKEKELSEELARIQDDVNNFNVELENLSTNISKKEDHINTLKKEIEDKKNEINSIKLNYEAQIRKAEMLESMENNLEGFTLSVKFIMSEVKKGNTAGIYGTVSKLIDVPKPYAVAIETAMMAYMQIIVVETQDDAKCLINLLKEKKIGRATFLPVSTIKGTELRRADFSKYAGFVGIASD
ncbi:MAG: AAA family ATPase, partial [Clostridia bacterium]|nr:AAA family ATPase [Clostridia bacterium]